MKRTILGVVVALMTTVMWAGTYKNPVIFADFPDPDVIRVGDTYYMATTTMHHFPGCTMLKSKDLVNWEYCAQPLEQLSTKDNYNLLNGQNLLDTIGQIIFAVFVGFALVILFHKGKRLVPCIVFHGVFNALSVIANDEAQCSALGGPVSAAVILIAASAVVLGGYSVWNWKHLKG